MLVFCILGNMEQYNLARADGHGLKKAGVILNRKMLAELAVNDKEAFAALAEQAKAAL